MPLTEKPGNLMEEPQEQITVLLGEIAKGNGAAKERLIALVYGKLHKMTSTLRPQAELRGLLGARLACGLDRPHPEPRRASGPILWLVQQRESEKAEESSNRGFHGGG
jgi:hypothetical protein